VRILSIQFFIWVGLVFGQAMQAADWSFVMLGDTRGNRTTTTTGISDSLGAIATKIASLSPDLVMVAGDLCNGNDLPGNATLSYTDQFNYWKAAMNPVYDYVLKTGIPIYTVRGNHENNDSEGPIIPELKQAYYDAFGKDMPQNWSATGNYTGSSQVGYSYSKTYKNMTMVVADQYFYYTAEGYHSLDETWVTDQFQASTTPFNIFMAHVPIYQTEGSGGSERFFGTDAAADATRAAFWGELGASDVQVYVTGHIHNETVASTPNGIIQVLAGNGGAPLDPIVNTPEAGVEVLYTNDQFGFSLATVRDDSMTIQYYSLTGNDTWSIAGYTTVITVPEPSVVCLMGLGLGALGIAGLRAMRPRRRI